jgi:two-component system response regulator NreC
MSIDTDGVVAGAQATGGVDGTVTVMIVDERRLMLEALALLVQSLPGFSISALAQGVDEARRYARGHLPDIAIIGPHRNEHADGREAAALELMAATQSASPQTKPVLVSDGADLSEIREAVGAGASGVLHAEAEVEDLRQAVSLVASGRPFIPPGIAVDLLRENRSNGNGSLTERETEILRGIALGYTNAEIAEQFVLSVRTVESHRAHVQQKLALSGRAQLVRYALDHGLVR